MKRIGMLLPLVLLLAGCGKNFEWFPRVEVADTTAPTVSAFVYYTENGSLTAHVESLTASDNVAVTGYLITESATVPAAADSGWSTTVPATHAMTSVDSKILYAWARDAAGNVSTAKSFGPVYTVQGKIDFPAGVGWVGDIASDKNSSSLWLLAGTSGPPPNSLVKIDAVSGQVTAKLDGVDWADKGIDSGSSLAFDGSTFWISSSAYDNSVTPAAPRSEIYRILDGGVTAPWYATYPCPATQKGFCQGLTWDGTNLWAAGSDNQRLVRFHLLPDGTLSVVTPSPDLWSTNGVSDMGFDSVTGRLLVLKDGLITVDALSLSLLGSRSFTLPGIGRGEWDGTLFWVADNVNRKLLGLSFP